jgi:hypothetical protein
LSVIACHSSASGRGAKPGSAAASQASYSSSAIALTSPGGRPPTGSSMSITSGRRVRVRSAAAATAPNSRSTMRALASPCSRQKAIVGASSRMLSALSTAARHRHAVMRLQGRRDVAGQHRDRVARADAARGERRRQPAAALGEAAIVVAALAMDHGRLGRIDGGGALEEAERRERRAIGRAAVELMLEDGAIGAVGHGCNFRDVASQ